MSKRAGELGNAQIGCTGASGLLATKLPDVAGGHINSSWFASPEYTRPTPTGKQCMPWPHEQEGVQILLPSAREWTDLKTEFYQRVEGQPLGPATQRWRDKLFLWATQLRQRFFGKTERVTGLWQVAYPRFHRRLQRLRDKVLATRIDREIKRGVKLPFDRKPPTGLRAKANHPRLGERKKEVFDAICMQLREGSLQGFDVRGGKRPKGVYSLRWIEKSNPLEVRLTLNGRPVNPFFPSKETTIELEMQTKLRTRYVPGQMFFGFDLHNGFFHQSYVPQDRTWVSFKISEHELGPEYSRRLRKRLPTSWVGGWFYLSYVGLVMGLSPSCQQLQRIMDALMDVWRTCKVQNLTWDGSPYIDDTMVMASGTFRGAVELAVRLLTEFIVLGFSVNLNHKTTIIPTTYYCHIGICVSSTKMRFSLPERRACKMRLWAERLHAAAVVGKKVSAKLVAKFIGLLWSASIVCFRAVAIMARAMIRTITVMLGESEAVGESDLQKLKQILRRVWGGNVVWTVQAQEELLFWLQVDFRKLSAPVSHDAWSDKVTAWVISPKTGEMASDVRVFAVDTSDSMSGGGEFVRDGELWRMKGAMAVKLTPEEVLGSSTLRELLGVQRLDLSLAPRSANKIILPLDSQAAVSCLLRGSKVKVLQRVVRQIFLNQLRHGRIVWPVWMRRTMEIIRMCDDLSRLVDNHSFALDPAVFWQANDIAIGIWGRGFQLDACADMHNVQPGDHSTRLPFFSRWVSPMSSGVNMLEQVWVGKVVWCNPPFPLLPRVFALLRAQQACAAVLIPLKARKAWSRTVVEGAPGVLHVLEFDFKRQLAVVFVDYGRNPPSANFHDDPSAEDLSECREGMVKYMGVGGTVQAVLPAPVCADVVS